MRNSLRREWILVKAGKNRGQTIGKGRCKEVTTAVYLHLMTSTHCSLILHPAFLVSTSLFFILLQHHLFWSFSNSRHLQILSPTSCAKLTRWPLNFEAPPPVVHVSTSNGSKCSFTATQSYHVGWPFAIYYPTAQAFEARCPETNIAREIYLLKGKLIFQPLIFHGLCQFL